SSATRRVFPDPSAPCSDTSDTTARCCLSSASSFCRPTNGTGPIGVIGFVIFEVRRRIGALAACQQGMSHDRSGIGRGGSVRQPSEAWSLFVGWLAMGPLTDKPAQRCKPISTGPLVSSPGGSGSASESQFDEPRLAGQVDQARQGGI